LFIEPWPNRPDAGRVPGRQSLAADGPTAVTFPNSAVSASQTPVSFTPDQVNALRAQIHALKLITSSVPVPENIQQAIRVPGPQLEKLRQGSNVVVDNAVWEAKGEPVGGEDVERTRRSKSLSSPPLPLTQFEELPECYQRAHTSRPLFRWTTTARRRRLDGVARRGGR
jgi:hypothetical protein